MDLILWRHAQAEYHDGDDLTRLLTAKGHRQAQLMANWLQTHLPKRYTVWASEAARSQQTAAYLSKDYLISSALNPEIDAATLPALLADTPHHDTLVIVGHQPWIGEMCAFMLNGHWHNPAWSVKKGGFWWFQVKENDNDPRTKLKAALTPAMLKPIDD